MVIAITSDRLDVIEMINLPKLLENIFILRNYV